MPFFLFQNSSDQPSLSTTTTTTTTATTVPDPSAGDSTATEAETTSAAEASQLSKRKSRPAHSSKYANSPGHASKHLFKRAADAAAAPAAEDANKSLAAAKTSTAALEPSQDHSLTSNTAKYFRSFMTKMQGNNNNNNNSSTNSTDTENNNKPKTGEFLFGNDPLWTQFKLSPVNSEVDVNYSCLFFLSIHNLFKKVI